MNRSVKNVKNALTVQPGGRVVDNFSNIITAKADSDSVKTLSQALMLRSEVKVLSLEISRMAGEG